MLLRSLQLEHFRNYAHLEETFEPGLVLLEGANAQGKTNLLEAIYLLATTKSVRARTDTELIGWGEHDPLSPIGFARVVGRVERGHGQFTLDVVIREGSAEGGGARKRFRLNGQDRRAGDVLGRVNAVFFSPSDVDLVDGSPSVRRRYLDVMLCQVDAAYVRTLNQYNRVILQRNALLRQVRERQQPASELSFWDQSLCEYGALLLASRAAAIADLARTAGEQHATLSGGAEALSLQYRPGLPEAIGDSDLAAGGAPAALDALRAGLQAMREREIASGMSLVGPHRDDLLLAVNGMAAGAFASRGQQRTATLALKLAELAYMRRHTGEEPILLLDDATSELDPRRREAILAVAASGQQTFMTSADGASLGALPIAAQRWEVRHGSLRRI